MKKTFIALTAFAALCACNKQQIDPETTVETPVAGQNQIVCNTPSVDTKTATMSTAAPYSVVWLDTDAVKVFGESAPEGVNYVASVDEVASSAVFTAEGTPVTDQDRFAIYPAACVESAAEGVVTVSLAKLASQYYHSTIPNYGKYTNYVAPEGSPLTDKEYYETYSIFPNLPLAAKSSNEVFSFDNLTGCVILNLNDYQGNAIFVRSIKLTTDKYISGKMLVNTADGSFTLSGDNDDQKSVTVVSTTETGVKISPSDYTKSSPNLGNKYPFYFFIPAGEYNGIEFEITLADGRVIKQSTDKKISIDTGRMSAFPTVQITLYYGADNTYQTTPGSTVNVDVRAMYSTSDRLVRENKLIEGTLPTLTANVEWELATDATALAERSIVSSAALDGDVLKVSVGEKTGNAVVSIKDGEKIVWSYHIWVTDATPSDIPYVQGSDNYSLMDRDLGAVWAPTWATRNANKAYMTYGMLYEWGRKDPLPTYGVSAYATASKTLFGQEALVRNYPVNCFNNPLTRFVGASGKKDASATIYPQSINNQILWGVKAAAPINTVEKSLVKQSNTVKTVYDPCPAGYMVPQTYHFQALKANVPSATNRQGYCAFLNPGLDTPATATATAYNLRGYIAVDTVVADGTDFASNGTQANTWTSTPWGTDTWGGAAFSVTFASNKISVANLQFATSAMCSVRCMKIQ